MGILQILFGPILLFGWFIINIVYTFKKIRNILKAQNKDVKLVVKCEKCQEEHNATIDEFFSTTMNKTKTTTTSANIGTIGASSTYYKYFAKKFYCSKCNKKTWSEIKNYNNLAMRNTKLMMPIILKCFVSIFIGAAIIISISELFA